MKELRPGTFRDVSGAGVCDRDPPQDDFFPRRPNPLGPLLWIAVTP
jgi:hypothetical protein